MAVLERNVWLSEVTNQISQQTLYTYWDSNSSLDAPRSVDVNKHWLNTRAFLTNKNPNGCAKISVH